MSNMEQVTAELDLLDLRILHLLTDNPLWKTKIYRTLDTHSVQTIGRRVDRLQNNGLLDTCILTPEEIKRELIIGYKTSDSGQRLLTEYQICETEDCGKLIHNGEDHIHQFISVADYFSITE